MDGGTINDHHTPIDLASLPARLDRLATPTTPHLGVTQPEVDVLRQLVQLTHDVMRAEHVVCQGFGVETSADSDTDPLFVASVVEIEPHDRAELAGLAASAARSLRTEVRKSGASFLIATVARQANQLRVIVSRLRLAGTAIEPFVLTQQLITGSITTWDERQRRQQLTDRLDAQQWTAELIEAIDASQNWMELSNRIVDIAAIHLQAHQVALCTRRSQSKPLLDVAAVGGDGAVIDASDWQMAAAETVLRKAVTTAPTAPDQRVATMAHQQLAESVSDHHRTVSVPLFDTDGDIIAVLVIVIDQGQTIPDSHLQWIGQRLATRLAAWKTAHQPLPERLIRTMTETFRSRRGMAVAAMVFLIVAMLPVHYQVGGEAVLVPQTKNFVVAPHDGSIHEVLVRVGDVIEPGTTIAELDDRELRIELAALIAERDRAAKQRDVFRSEGKIADEQLAEAELARVEEKIRLAQHRLDNLMITSPIGGVILSGDLDGVTGAAVETGQVLAEVAELDQLWIEVEVPQEELAEIRTGQSLRVALDADVVPTLDAKIESISPSAQVRGGQSVFIARAVAENSHQQLRPGLTGRAKIESNRRPLWKIVFRRLRRSLGRLWV